VSRCRYEDDPTACTGDHSDQLCSMTSKRCMIRAWHRRRAGDEGDGDAETHMRTVICTAPAGGLTRES